MNLFKIIAIALIAVIAIVLLRQTKPEMALIVGIGASIIIVLSVMDELFEVVYSFYSMAEATKINKDIFTNILKIIGIGYVAEFGNGICVDSGCKGIGEKIVFAGKIAILMLALPIIKSLIAVIVEILP